jgi:hypothetical protein
MLPKTHYKELLPIHMLLKINLADIRKILDLLEFPAMIQLLLQTLMLLKLLPQRE